MKKVLSILLLTLFMSINSVKAFTNVNYLTEDADCITRVDTVVAQADATGEYTLAEIEWISNTALAIYCYGYTMEEVIAASQD
jgi:hypothetical protein